MRIGDVALLVTCSQNERREERPKPIQYNAVQLPNHSSIKVIDGLKLKKFVAQLMFYDLSCLRAQLRWLYRD